MGMNMTGFLIYSTNIPQILIRLLLCGRTLQCLGMYSSEHNFLIPAFIGRTTRLEWTEKFPQYKEAKQQPVSYSSPLFGWKKDSNRGSLERPAWKQKNSVTWKKLGFITWFVIFSIDIKNAGSGVGTTFSVLFNQLLLRTSCSPGAWFLSKDNGRGERKREKKRIAK